MNELVELMGYHHKSVLSLLRQLPDSVGSPLPRAGVGKDAARSGRQAIRYGPDVVNVLEARWEASNHLFGKRLAAVLPTLVPVLESHGHLVMEPQIPGPTRSLSQ